jgi:hypothetical protein
MLQYEMVKIMICMVAVWLMGTFVCQLLKALFVWNYI